MVAVLIQGLKLKQVTAKVEADYMDVCGANLQDHVAKSVSQSITKLLGHLDKSSHALVNTD